MSLDSEIASWRTFRAKWKALSPDSRRARIAKYKDAELAAVNWWLVQRARDAQFPPAGDWLVWLILTGRGWGKTRCGAELTDEVARSGETGHIHIVARTAADARDVLVEGESGILAIAKPGQRPEYEPSKRRLTWKNGCTATLFSADEPDSLRGPQCGFWWADELAAWKYVDETWDMLQLGARLGRHVRGIVTTTPRPLKIIKELIANPGTVVTRGSTFENEANLAQSFIGAVRSRYEGTRLGRQELGGEVLDDNPDALWKREWIDKSRVLKLPNSVDLSRVVVAVDPSTTPTGDEAGIVVEAKGTDGEFYTLADYSLQAGPLGWAQAAVTAYYAHKADVLVYEANQGGDMVKETIRSVDRHVNIKSVTASRGKATRAEPIAALSEQGRVHHVGAFPKLEDELCEWVPGPTTASNKSPNRLDAHVWGLTELSQKITPAFFDRSKIGV